MLKLLDVELIYLIFSKTLCPINKVFNDIENYFLKLRAYLLYHQYNCLKTKIESFVINTKENVFFEYYTLSMR